MTLRGAGGYDHRVGHELKRRTGRREHGATVTGPRTRPSVVLVREWELQMSSSSCCGRLEGDFLAPDGQRCFPERREIMEAMGPLYRALRERHGDAVDVHVVDPRNLITVVGLLVEQVRAGRVGWLGALRALFGLSVTSVLVNGRLLCRGRWPSADEVSAALAEGAPTRREVPSGMA